ncbi:universal stress protein [Streptomyces phaeochromogenes]|uniref:universal stress protein n=1 Tax=Streptomyces phaeochromogenes TaxID=1923 RepID=UPI003865E5CC|nr:universal stress protein [Streptomyces phaeochromogenes]
MTTRRVTVGVDGSLIAVRALDRAADEAVLRGTALEIVYAVPDIDEAGPILASSALRARDRHPGLPVTTSAVQGSPVQALLRHSRDAALTVVGTRGLGGITGRLFGSVSLRLAAHSHTPLLVVRGDHAPARRGGVLLLGLESEADTDAAAYAFEEAERRGAGLSILRAWNYRHLTPEQPDPLPTHRLQDDLVRQARTEQAVPRFAVAGLREQHPGVGVETHAVRSGPAHALLEATRDADVVVIGAHRRPNRLGPQLGPVTHALLHRSHCPVLVVHTGQAAVTTG